MKVDLTKYPDIPEGCQLNYNKISDSYQVFRPVYKIDKKTGKRKRTRESVGSIKKGVFCFSAKYNLSRTTR